MSDPSGCSQITCSLRLRIVPGTEAIRVVRGIRVQGFVVLVFRRSGVCRFRYSCAVLLEAFAEKDPPSSPFAHDDDIAFTISDSVHLY